MKNDYSVSETFKSSEKDRKRSYLAALARIIKAERELGKAEF